MTAQWRKVIAATNRMHRTPIVDGDYPEVQHYYHRAQREYDDLPKMPTIVCLCGSTKFKDQFLEVQRELTLQGKIVLSVGSFGHADSVEWTEAQKQRLDELHKRKIDLADEVYVINVDGYIGSSTHSEINYASNTGKKITYYLTEQLEKQRSQA